MLLELITFLGTSVGGSFLGHIGRWIQGRSEAKTDERENDFQQRLADKKQLSIYLENLNKQNPDLSYSPLSYAVTFLILLLGCTYCACTASFFFWEPNQIIHTKDPTEEARSISLFFGFIKWDQANDKILSMSRGGVGFLMCYPVIFILSMVVTGEKPKRSR